MRSQCSTHEFETEGHVHDFTIVRSFHHFSNIELMVTPSITGQLPSQPVKLDNLPQEVQEQLADPKFDTQDRIDILLGAGIWAQIIQSKVLRHKFGTVVQKTIFGWILMGNHPKIHPADLVNTIRAPSPDEDINAILCKHWEIEEGPIQSARTPEQQVCEDIFMKHHYRDEGGRYVVCIPTSEHLKQLGSSKLVALNRFHQLESRFNRDPDNKQKYVQFMREYEDLGHMQKATRAAQQPCYHIPHHCVTKKFRVVFDASCATDTGVSLNEVQLVGEKVQSDLAELLMRFRCFKVGITADVKNMYRQVRISPEQWDLQRIF